VQSNRGFTVEGTANTSHGVVDTKVVQSINFDNAQKYYIRTDGSIFDQFVGQETSISSATTTTNNGNVTTASKQMSWPVNLSYDFKANADGSYQQFSQVHQGFMESVLVKLNGTPTYSSSLSDTVAPMDTLSVDPAGNGTPSGQASSETYQYSDSTGACWNETIRAAGGALTSVQGGNCSRHVGHIGR